MDVFNPATGEVIRQLTFSTDRQVEQAVSFANEAFQSWSKTSPIKRAHIFFKFKNLLEENIDCLAKIISTEHGKVLADAKGEVLRAIELVEFMCGIPNLLKSSYSENVASDVDCYSVRQPLGVCVGVSPFNFPVMVPCWMLVTAIACGNCFILKPSEKDPSAAEYIADLFKKAGLPDNVLTIIHGNKKIVEQLIKHKDVKAVSCVGSTPVAESIYQLATNHHKRAQTFGGAKNHCIVMPDANIDEAAIQITGAAFGAAGERCMALPVVIGVTDELTEKLMSKIKLEAEKIKVGPGNDLLSDMGPLITKDHLERVKSFVNAGVLEGAELMLDGRDLKIESNPKGFFMGPCIFDQVQTNMKIYKEEIFGPVLCVLRANNFDEALTIINANRYGNGAAIFTSDGEIARTFASEVQVGMVGINVPIPVPVAYHSFGGWKESSFGDLRMHGEEAVLFYTKAKTITSRWYVSDKNKSAFHMPSNNN